MHLKSNYKIGIFMETIKHESQVELQCVSGVFKQTIMLKKNNPGNFKSPSKWCLLNKISN